MKTIIVDPQLCVQCTNCQIACKDEHCGTDRAPVAAAQPEGQFWIRIEEEETGSGSRMRLNRTPVVCQHCEHPACLEACPNGAIYQREDGLVIIDPEKCQGCGSCREACPYGMVYENAERGISQKCTGCAHLLDRGWERPRCVNACPTDALRWVEEEELAPENLYAPLEKLHPEYGTAPRVAYTRQHRPFIAGGVFSPSEDRSLEGVHVSAVHLVTGERREAVTDNFGDFSFDGLEPGFYDLSFTAEGYYPKALGRCDARSGLNVEDVALFPKLS